MTAKQEPIRFTTTHPKILMFPHLHEPAAQPLKNGKVTKDKFYSASFMITPTDPDFEGFLRACLGEAKRGNPEIWASAPAATLRDKLVSLLNFMDMPLKPGDIQADARQAKQKDDAEFLRGNYVIKAKSGETYPPSLGGIENGRAVDYDTAEKLAMSKSKFFFGAESLFQVTIKYYDAVNNGQPGVKAYLSKVFVTGKGTKMSSGGSAAETFSGYMGHSSTINPVEDIDLPY